MEKNAIDINLERFYIVRVYQGETTEVVNMSGRSLPTLAYNLDSAAYIDNKKKAVDVCKSLNTIAGYMDTGETYKVYKENLVRGVLEDPVNEVSEEDEAVE